LCAFFFYVVNILAFVNQPPWHIKAVIIAIFSIPAFVFLLLGAFIRGFSHARRDTGIVLLSASALSALAMLSFFCAWASPDMARHFPQTHFISLATLYLVLFALVFMSSLDLADHSSPVKAPNHTMQLTGSVCHAGCDTPADPPAASAPHSACS
jgi:hypothetical protein